MPAALVPPDAAATQVEADGGSWRVLTPRVPPPARTPALLLHGGGFDHAGISWFRMIGALGAERPVIAPDLPGFGGTRSVPVKARADLVADQVAALLDALAIDQVIVCGVSMGGEIALQFGLRHRDRTTALVAIAPGGLRGKFGATPVNLVTWLATRVPDRGLDLISRASAPWARTSIESIIRHPLPEAALDEFVAEAHRTGSGVAYGKYNRFNVRPTRMRNNLLPYLSALDAPTLFFHGEQDTVVPIQGSVNAALLMPNAHLIRIADCGHWAHLEKHDEFIAAWRQFISPY